MTAIYGIWRFDGMDVRTDLRRLEFGVRRYGSDDFEVWSPHPSLALGRRLHRSLPEDIFPTPFLDRHRYRVVADVRLTERDELASQLGLGADAARMSDAAVVSIALESWHEQAFDRIYGAFAIAAWDTLEQRLLLARDYLGSKPLFFHSGDNFFAFASMPDGLHCLPDVPRGPDIESMKRFLVQENEGFGRTHFEAIGRVMPGHYAIVKPSELEQTRYWHPDLSQLRLPTHGHYVNALTEHLDRAVAAALRGAEMQVATHLSSGFDSTAVATAAARQLATGGGTVVAYTAAPREGYEIEDSLWIADESALAKATADMYQNMEHVIMRTDRTPMADLARTSTIYAVPVMNICNTTWYDAINDDVRRRGISVLLYAFMGNATISETGTLALPELIRKGRIFSWIKLSIALIRNKSSTFVAIIWESFSQVVPDALYRKLIESRHGPLVSMRRCSSIKGDHLHHTVREAASESSIPGASSRILKTGWARPTSNSLYERLILLSPDYEGPSNKGILGEWKIDYRDPTADRRLVEFSLRVPVEELIRAGDRRAILRGVLARRAPPEVLESRRKGLQGADWHEWFREARGEIAEEIARIEMSEPCAELIDVPRLKALVDNWPNGGDKVWSEWGNTVDYRWCLLRAISAASFMRQAARSNY